MNMPPEEILKPQLHPETFRSMESGDDGSFQWWCFPCLLIGPDDVYWEQLQERSASGRQLDVPGDLCLGSGCVSSIRYCFPGSREEFLCGGLTWLV